MILEQMITFVTVVDENGVTKAAEKLNLTAAAVSKQLTTLERNLSASLIIRSTRSLKLTDLGEEYYQASKTLIKEYEHIKNIITFSNEKPIGQITVTSSLSFAQNFLIPNLNKFLNTYKEITLDLKLDERLPDFTQEQTEITIGQVIPYKENAIQKIIGFTNYICVASPSYLKEHKPIKKPFDLKNQSIVTHSIRQPPNVYEFKNHPPLSVSPSFVVNNSIGFINLLEEGLGVGRVLEYSASKSLAKGRLVEILKPYRVKQPIYLAYRNTKYIPKKIKVFIDFVKEHTAHLN